MSIKEVEQEYHTMLEANRQHLDQINQIEEEYSGSAGNSPPPLITDDFSKWAEMMKRYVESEQDSLQPAEERSTSVARQRAPFFLPVKKEAAMKPLEAPQKDKFQDDAKQFVVDPKVKTILTAFSADHDIFWFRF